MTRLVIHQPKNFESRRYRYYNLVFDAITAKLRESFDVMECGYYKYANQGYSPTLLLHNATRYNDTNIQLLECEMIIENYETKEIKVLSASDDLTGAILNFKGNPLLTKTLVAQFDRKKIHSHLPDENDQKKICPWVYFPTNDYDFDAIENRRHNKTILGTVNQKFYFRGSSLECRRIVAGFNPELFTGGGPIGGFESYTDELLNYRLGFSIAGRGEFCYRDIEYMAMGVPYIRFEYNSEMAEPLVPDFHYVSVPRPPDAPNDRDLRPEHAPLIEARFLEVRNDIDYLNFIANNALDYYNKHVKMVGCVNHTLKLLEIDKWL